MRSILFSEKKKNSPKHFKRWDNNNNAIQR